MTHSRLEARLAEIEQRLDIEDTDEAGTWYFEDVQTLLALVRECRVAAVTFRQASKYEPGMELWRHWEAQGSAALAKAEKLAVGEK